jgi:hypothetical protein
VINASLHEDRGRPNPRQPVVRQAGDSPGIVKKTVMNRRMWAAWDVTVDRLGFGPVISQGAYKLELDPPAAEASAHFHDLGGCIDTDISGVSQHDIHKTIKIGREVGWAVWHRFDAQFPDNTHLHWLLVGDETAHPRAIFQMAQYRKPFPGSDGLAGDGPDPHFDLRPDPIPIFNYEKFLSELEDDVRFDDTIPGTQGEQTVADVFRATLRLERAFGTFREAQRARNQAIRKELKAAQDAVDALPDATPATKAEIKRMINELNTRLHMIVDPSEDEQPVEPVA